MLHHNCRPAQEIVHDIQDNVNELKRSFAEQPKPVPCSIIFETLEMETLIVPDEELDKELSDGKTMRDLLTYYLIDMGGDPECPKMEYKESKCVKKRQARLLSSNDGSHKKRKVNVDERKEFDEWYQAMSDTQEEADYHVSVVNRIIDFITDSENVKKYESNYLAVSSDDHVITHHYLMHILI